MASIFIFILAFASYTRQKDANRFNQIFESERQERKQMFEKFVAFQSRQIEAFVYDYTYWDEMVAYTRSRNQGWSLENIESVLDNFSVDAVWIYDSNFTLINQSPHSLDQPWPEPLDRDTLANRIARKWFSHFFVSMSGGFMEIHTTPIQPSSDNKRISSPQGYFVAGRMWTKRYQQQLADLVNGEVSIIPSPSSRFASYGDSVDFSIPIHAINGLPLAYIHAAFSVPEVGEINRLAIDEESNLLIIVVVVMTSLMGLLAFWVGIPLSRISVALNTQSEKPLKRLRNKSDEFGRIAILMEYFFEQKSQLEKQIKEKESLETVLRASELDYRLLFENAHEAMFILDDEGRILRFNRHGAKLYGYSEKEFEKLTIQEIWPDWTSHIAESLGEQGGSFEFEHRTREGRVIIVEAKFTKISYKNTPTMLSIHRNITERKFLEEVRLSYEILNQLDNLVVLTNELGQVIYVNQASKKMLGYLPAELLGDHWWFSVYSDEEQRTRDWDYAKKAVQGGILFRDTIFELATKNKQGDVRLIEWHQSIRPGQFLISVGYDITERKKIQQSDENLRIQKARIAAVLQTQEEERRRLAHELHDGLSQQLSAIRRHVELITISPQDTKSLDYRKTALKLSDEAANEARTMSYRLMPRVLEELGLEYALNKLVEDSGLRISFQSFNLRERYSKDIELAVYRILQESLQNIVKHAEAKSVSVQIIGHIDKLILVVEDDGIGSIFQKQILGLEFQT